jgi:protein-tyrosine phosphatase
LIYTSFVWHILRLLLRESAHNEVTQELVVGRRLLPGELEGEFDNYVDLTAEFAEPLTIRRRPGYVCFPILDMSAPEADDLREFLARLRPGKTFVHCAQGHGRTGLFALAWLIQSGAVRTVGEGLEKLRAVRPRICLTRMQRRCIEEFAANVQP